MRPPQSDAASDPELIRVATEALKRLLPHEADLSIKSVEFTTIASATGTGRTQLVLNVSGVPRAMLLGQFAPFSPRQMRGFHANYVFGYVHAWFLATRGVDLGSEYELVLEAAEGSPLGGGSDLCHTELLENLLGSGRLHHADPLVSAMRRLGLDRVLMAGRSIAGPSAGMLELVESYCRQTRIQTVVDLYSGSGALALAALAGGTQNVVCLDEFFDSETKDALRDRFAANDATVSFVEGKIGHHSLRNLQADVALCDPFYDFTLETLDWLLPVARTMKLPLIVNLGPASPRNWASLIRDRLYEIPSQAYTIEEYYGELLCSTTI